MILDVFRCGGLLGESGSAAGPRTDEALEGIVVEPTQGEGPPCFSVLSTEERKGKKISYRPA